MLVMGVRHVLPQPSHEQAHFIFPTNLRVTMTKNTKVTQATKDLLADIAKHAVPFSSDLDESGYPTAVIVRDEKSHGGVHHEYVVIQCDDNGDPIRDKPVLAKIQFQKGGRAVNGINGCTNEDLIGIVMHRLSCLQSGEFPSEFNNKALAALDSGLFWLTKRTQDRLARGVEGMEKA